MTLKEYKRIKKYIDKQIDICIERMLEEKENISSKKVQDLLDRYKTKLLNDSGVNVDEYLRIENEEERVEENFEEREISYFVDIAKKVKSDIKKREDRVNRSIDNNFSEFNKFDKRIKQTVDNFDIHINNIKEEVNINKNRTNDYLKVNTKALSLAERKIDKIQSDFFSSKAVLTEDIIRLLNIFDEVDKKIEFLQKDSNEKALKDELINMKDIVALIYDMEKKLLREMKKRMKKVVVPRRWPILTVGGSGRDVPDFEERLKVAPEDLSSQCDGSTTVFTTSQTISGVDWISLNGALLIEGKDFTKTSNYTITLSTVTPDSGEELYIKYFRQG